MVRSHSVEVNDTSCTLTWRVDERRERVFGYKCSEAEMVALSSLVFLSPSSLPLSILPSSLSCCTYTSNLYPLTLSLTVPRKSQWQQKQAGRSTLNLSAVGWNKPWTSMAWTWAPFSLVLQLCTFGKSISSHVLYCSHILMIAGHSPAVVIKLTCRDGVFP